MEWQGFEMALSAAAFGMKKKLNTIFDVVWSDRDWKLC